jgi:hypothetical protein
MNARKTSSNPWRLIASRIAIRLAFNVACGCVAVVIGLLVTSLSFEMGLVWFGIGAIIGSLLGQAVTIERRRSSTATGQENQT